MVSLQRLCLENGSNPFLNFDAARKLSSSLLIPCSLTLGCMCLCVCVCVVAYVHEIETGTKQQEIERERADREERYERVGPGCLPPRPREHKEKNTAIKPLYDYEY